MVRLIYYLGKVVMRRIEFLGIKMDVASMSTTVSVIDQGIYKHQFLQHAVINVAKLIHMRRDKQLYDSVEACDIINIDGIGVMWGARFLGHDIPEKVSGIDLFYELLTLSSQRGYPVFFLGAEQEVVVKAVAVLQKRYNRLRISGFHHGYFWDNEVDIVNEINTSGARLLFVAITSPKKEIFINTWKDQLGVDFVMGVGGTFDVVASKIARAPSWMQNYGLEWLYRLIQEPGRMWRRYLISNTEYVCLLLREKFSKMTGWK